MTQERAMTVASKHDHTTLEGGMGWRWYEVVWPLYSFSIPPYHLKREKAL
jgi:hypothetical protein